MSKADSIFSYEELVNYTDEVRDSLAIVNDRLADNSYAVLIKFALCRLEELVAEHRAIIEKEVANA